MNSTPGPWFARPRHVDNDGTQDEMGGLGWDIEGPPEPMLRGQFALAGDAYLVASAPLLKEINAELLAALAACERWIDSVTGGFGVHEQLEAGHPLFLARAAIRKATG